MQVSTHVHALGLADSCSDEVLDDIQQFFWGEGDDSLDEDELIKAAIARSLQGNAQPADVVKLQELLEEWHQQQVKKLETCELVILRKRLLQTCLTAIKDESFDFLKIPRIRFSGEDAEDLGGPQREFFRLLMKTVCGEFGVFEGKESSLVFTHNHSVLEKRKPFIAGQFVAWSLMHNGPGLHCLSKDLYYLMLQLPERIDTPRAIASLADEDAVSIVNELLAVSDEEALQDIMTKNLTWFLDHGITVQNQSKEDMCCQVIKQFLYYR